MLCQLLMRLLSENDHWSVKRLQFKGLIGVQVCMKVKWFQSNWNKLEDFKHLQLRTCYESNRTS